MGVTGLWRLLEPAGKPVPLETLENKVLAVDISIWLHQMVKGFQDPRGGAVTNAHLLGLFQRLCKLLFYRIKPIFVFDGGVPTLKRLTIMKRQNTKKQMHNTVDRMRQQLLGIVTKQLAVSTVLSEKSKSPKKRSSPIKSADVSRDDEDLFKLPPMVKETAAASTEEESDSEEEKSKHHNIDLHNLDVNSAYFKKLTPREKHDLLTELKETRKQSSWGRIHELPVQSDNFSDYQMKRLLKRRQVQVSLEETEKEMGGHFLSLNELEILLNEEGIDTKIENITSRRIASNEQSHFVLIKDVKEAFETAAKKQAEEQKLLSEPSSSKDPDIKTDLGDEFDEDLDYAIKLSLQCSDDSKPSCSATKDSNIIDLTFLGPDFIETDSEWSTDDDSEGESKSLGNIDLALAKSYMLENSGLSEYEITRIINSRSGTANKNIKRKKKYAKYVPFNTETVPENVSVTKSDNKLDTDNIIAEEETKISLDTNVLNVIKEEVDSDIEIVNKPILGISNHNSPQTETSKKFSSDSDTDESFEEVPEVILPSIELELKTDPIIDDDIFSDVFQTPRIVKPNSIDDVKDLFPNKIITETKDIPAVDSMEIPKIPIDDKPVVIDGELEGIMDFISKTGEESPLQNVLEIDEGISDVEEVLISVDTQNIEENFSEPAKKMSPEHTPIKQGPVLAEKTFMQSTPQTDKNIVQNTSHNIETESSLTSEPQISPQKGMTLNEIRHKICQETPDRTAVVENKSMEKKMISTEELSLLADDLAVERDKIEKQQNKLDRMGRNISDEMTKDAQDLLQMFGIPFIVAPMEAEAQCAFLESINLSDGTITDDSDIWLFGGKSVYKNFFNQQKYVLQFLSENIKNCFKLSREQLVLLALLVGSDYTTGVNGVGPVTALEILAAFPPANAAPEPPYLALLTGLKKFQSWLNNNRAFGHNSLRNKLKNTSLGQEFPSQRVVEAYLSPAVDKNKEAFTWGKPDITAIRDFTRIKFGWSQSKTDETLKPVMKSLEEKKRQQSVRAFFRTEIKRTAAEDNMSKRVKMAVERMGNENLECEVEPGPSQSKKPRKAKETVLKGIRSKIAKKVVVKSTPIEDNKSEVTSISISEDIVPKVEVAPEKKDLSKKKRRVKPFIPERYQEVIPQRESDKTAIVNTKLKAIELFRTSQKGPGFIKKRKKTVRKPKADAELSESSSD